MNFRTTRTISRTQIL